MNYDKIAINDNVLVCINVYLSPQDLIYLYSSFVACPMSMFVGCSFGDHSIYIDIEYVERFGDLFEHMGIIPDNRKRINQDYYDILLKK